MAWVLLPLGLLALAGLLRSSSAPAGPAGPAAPGASPKVLRWLPLVRAAVARYRPSPPVPLVLGVMHHESGGDPRARGAADDEGLMQEISSTRAHYHVRHGYDATENIEGGVHLLSDLIANLGGAGLPYVVAAYNVGEGAVKRSYPALPNPGYVHAVLAAMRLYARL